MSDGPFRLRAERRQSLPGRRLLAHLDGGARRRGRGRGRRQTRPK